MHLWQIVRITLHWSGAFERLPQAYKSILMTLCKVDEYGEDEDDEDDNDDDKKYVFKKF